MESIDDERQHGHQRVYLVGPSGSGKSVIADRIGRLSGWNIVDTDAEIREGAGRSISRIFEQEGEEEFRRLELNLLSRISNSRDRLIVATGGGMPIIPTAMQIMLRTGITVYLEANVEELWTRVLGDLNERPLLRGPDGFARLQSLVQQREPIYRMSAVTVRTEQLTVAQVVNLVLSQLPGFRADAGHLDEKDASR